MQASFEDSNITGIGSEADAEARKKAAAMEVDWAGCGQEEGVEIW